MRRAPFLLLTSRAEDHLSEHESAGLKRLTGLADDEVVQIRMEQAEFLPVPLDDVSGVILGGSPFTTSDPVEHKSEQQLRVEGELVLLLREVFTRDVPYLGLCYGIGVTSLVAGGLVDRTFGEGVGPTTVTVTDEGRADPVFGGMPPTFTAFTGHKEACSELPPGAVLLATNDACPVQAYRLGGRQYVTQFHPELEPDHFIHRIRAYRHLGYFSPETSEELIERVGSVDVSQAHGVLRGFVREFARPR
ncbi:MAG TPA: glutamine amidotransferase [Intrasporangium sp.]|uniref:glutamine amidotransferase n=1 Tax=Intrasporangium sp. TaxID=1925024 RepID=UPI002D79909F|nr:glutamine amidotransferase [Intrasporangium sp.]HET7399156.1 glutamine amidotransferase [Intrasporangium sp.]